MPPPLVYHRTLAEYRAHFERVYCREPLVTHDGIQVRFYMACFNHAFKVYERRKFVLRTQRIDWIRAVLLDQHLPRYMGIDKEETQRCGSDAYNPNRFVLLAYNDTYTVIIELTRWIGTWEGIFITAWTVDQGIGRKIRELSPPWDKGAVGGSHVRITRR